MHWGVFHGKEAEHQPKRILILAESHHINSTTDKKPGIPATYPTESVIRDDYYCNPTGKNYHIFDKIALSCGGKIEERADREAFWEKVYFGNYIDVLCGVRDDAAKTLLKNGPGNRQTYNDALFRFINDHQIDIVFCFSRLVYNHLPSLSKVKELRKQEDLKDIPCDPIGKQNDFIKCCKYLANTDHNATIVPLQKSLHVFGMRHPSARGGFDPAHYAEHLKQYIQ